MNDFSPLDREAITALRMLAVDQVEAARSGHPGMPLGAAPMAYVLFSRFLKHDPAHPDWFDRDRFILSAGHGSALLYALLHLFGYDLPMEELKNFRQWGSRTAGHPEYGCVPGVEATTGPLGQGFAMGVGMALAERHLAAQFNREGNALVDYRTYAIVSDGDLMEGVASEAASLAGHQKLGKLISLYDDNHISIDGDTDLAFTEDVCARFLAYGWHVERVADGEDLDAIAQAIEAARAETDRPSLIAVRTHIGFGSPKQDTAAVHGSPLGAEAMAATRKQFGWNEEPFSVPADVRALFQQCSARGEAERIEWADRVESYRRDFSEKGTLFARLMAHELPKAWEASLPVFASDGAMATRVASGKTINALAQVLPELMGGSADLAPSNNTFIANEGDMQPEKPAGRNMHFGVREHAMGAIVNGMALHGGAIPYGATFLVFSDYMRPAIRLAALMNAHSTFIFTHDSVGLGEDGPTHQPIEHVMSLRAIPNLTVLRPADANETAAAWRAAIEGEGPHALILSRQNLPVLEASRTRDAARGGYVLSDTDGAPSIILIATGSEVSLALQAQKALAEQKVAARVVSMPSWELFERQTAAYKASVLPPDGSARIAIEAGVTMGWERYVGDRGAVIGIDRFGASAPGDEVMQHLGLTVEAIVARALQLMA